jgi:hypothetical protein
VFSVVSPPRRWSIAFLVGATAGTGTLLAGYLGGILGLVAIALAVAEPPRAAAIGGLLIGLGVTWIALFRRVALTCQADCVAPDLRPWVAVAAHLTGLGILVTGREVRAR